MAKKRGAGEPDADDKAMPKVKASVPAIASPAPLPPSLHIEGPMAKKLHGLKPGSKVHFHVHGIVTDTGISSFGSKMPTARVEVQRMKKVQGKISTPKA